MVQELDQFDDNAFEGKLRQIRCILHTNSLVGKRVLKNFDSREDKSRKPGTASDNTLADIEKDIELIERNMESVEAAEMYADEVLGELAKSVKQQGIALPGTKRPGQSGTMLPSLYDIPRQLITYV